MPKYARTNRRTYRRPKRTYRKRYPSLQTPLARKLITRMKYNDQVTIDPAIGGICGVHVFSANGMYDPDITSTGHQPRGWDQLMTMYDHAVVLGSSITFEVSPDDNYPLIFGIAAVDRSSANASVNTYLESTKVVYKTIGAGSSGQPKRVSMRLNPNKFLSRSKPLSDPDLKNSTGSNPTEQAYYHCFIAALDGAANLAANYCLASLTYTAALIEPINPAQS